MESFKFKSSPENTQESNKAFENIKADAIKNGFREAEDIETPDQLLKKYNEVVAKDPDSAFALTPDQVKTLEKLTEEEKEEPAQQETGEKPKFTLDYIRNAMGAYGVQEVANATTAMEALREYNKLDPESKNLTKDEGKALETLADEEKAFRDKEEINKK